MEQQMTIIVTGGTTLENMAPGMDLKSQGSDTLGTRAVEKLLDAVHDGGATAAKIGKLYFIAPEGTIQPSVPDGQAYKLAYVRADSAKDMKDTIETILRREHVDILVHAAVTPGYEARYAARSEWFVSEILDQQEKGRLNADTLRRIFEEPSTQFADADSLPDHEKGLMFLMSSVPDPCMEARSISPMTRLIASVRRKIADTGHLFDAADEILQRSGAEAVIADGMDAMAEDKRHFMIVGEDKAMHRTATIGYGYGTVDMAGKIAELLFPKEDGCRNMLPLPASAKNSADKAKPAAERSFGGMPRTVYDAIHVEERDLAEAIRTLQEHGFKCWKDRKDSLCIEYDGKDTYGRASGILSQAGIQNRIVKLQETQEELDRRFHPDAPADPGDGLKSAAGIIGKALRGLCHPSEESMPAQPGTEVPPDCPLHGYADPSDVFRVSVNIIKEAIDNKEPGLDHYATVTGGRVRIEMLPAVKLLQDSYDLADRDDVGESFYGCLQSLLGFTLTPAVELEECLEEDPLVDAPGNAPATDLNIYHEDMARAASVLLGKNIKIEAEGNSFITVSRDDTSLAMSLLKDASIQFTTRLRFDLLSDDGDDSDDDATDIWIKAEDLEYAVDVLQDRQIPVSEEKDGKVCVSAMDLEEALTALDYEDIAYSLENPEPQEKSPATHHGTNIWVEEERLCDALQILRDHLIPTSSYRDDGITLNQSDVEEALDLLNAADISCDLKWSRETLHGN